MTLHLPNPTFKFPGLQYLSHAFKPLRRRFSISPAASAADTGTLPKTAIQRIAEKLLSLRYVEESSDDTADETLNPGANSSGEIFVPLPTRLPKYRVGFHELRRGVLEEEGKDRIRKRSEGKRKSAPSLAELTLPDDDLMRLRSIGILLKKKLKLGKAGIKEGIVNGIHERWRLPDLVKIACEDICRLNMKRTHDLLERKTGGLVIWRSGGIIILYRGSNYKYPYFLTNKLSNDSSSEASADIDKKSTQSPPDNTVDSTGLNSDQCFQKRPFARYVARYCALVEENAPSRTVDRVWDEKRPL
ncbi:hypothetical protein OROMI_032498 [Orobanche minor]